MRKWLLLLLLVGAAWGQESRTLLLKKSPFDTVVVTQEGNYRILKFRVKGRDIEQSRCDVKAPDRLSHEYSRLQLLGLLFPPRVDDILIVGLGGGSLSKALADLCPAANVVSIELDPVVAEAARRYFFYKESPRVRTVVGDARDYLEKTGDRYDLIFLDAFDGLEIPEPLRSRKFYRLVHDHLKPGGAAVANIHLTSHQYSNDRNTLAAVFPQQYSFLGTGLAMVVCQDTPERRSDEWIAVQSAIWGNRLPYPMTRLEARYQGEGEWDKSAPVIEEP